MLAPKVTYYRSLTTNMIHMIADFPEPRTKDRSQCGNLVVTDLEPLERKEVRKAANHEFCLKCSQLIGLK